MKIHPDDWRQLLGDIEQLLKERDEAQEIAKKHEDRYFGALVERNEARLERDEARSERDEARREVSELKANEANRLSSAVHLKGWICFEETQ
jgi:CHASE3 domain sensor protein